jgi:hypothetical protein
MEVHKHKLHVAPEGLWSSGNPGVDLSFRAPDMKAGKNDRAKKGKVVSHRGKE